MSAKRVLVIGPSHKGALPESYARAFERLGMEVFQFDDEKTMFRSSLAANRLSRRGFRSHLWRRLNRATVEIAQVVRPSLIFAVRASYLDPETVAALRKELGVPFTNHYPDHPYCGTPLDPRKPSTQRRNLLEVMREYTTVWIWEKGLVEKLRRDGVKAEYLPFGVDTELFQPHTAAESQRRDCDHAHEVSFAGTFLPLRQSHLEAVKQHAIGVWGAGWPRSWYQGNGRYVAHRPTYGVSLSRIHALSKVALNIVGDLNLPGHNMRTFEVPGSGGVMLSRYSDEQNQLFPENVAAAYYRDPSELDGKIAWLLQDSALRERIRREALRLSAAHSYDERAAQVLRYYGLQPA
jgi:glycosyltransferase involved in cell wall biosynthesis